MKKTLLLIIGILLSINLSAQTAEEFFNNVIEKTKSYNDVSIVFNYRIINKEANKIILYICNGMYPQHRANNKSHIVHIQF